MSCAWCPLSVLRGRRSLPPLSPAGSPAAACCSRPAQSASEPAGSWRGKKPSRESSQGDQCVRACLCVSESERERESRTGNQRTRAHTRALSVSTDFYSLRASCRPPQRAQKAAIRTRKVAQFFFFSSVVVGAVSRRALPRGGFTGRNWIVVPPAEAALIRRGHEELKASLVLSSPQILYSCSPVSPFSSGLGCGGSFRIPLNFLFFPPLWEVYNEVGRREGRKCPRRGLKRIKKSSRSTRAK